MQITTGSAVACSPPHPAARQQHRRAPPSAWVAALGTPSHGAARQRQHRRPVIFHQAASIAHSCTSPRPASRPRRARRPSPEAPQQTRAKVGHGAAAHCRPQPHLTAPTVAQLGGAGMWCAGQACAGAGAGRQAAWRCVRCRVRDAHCEPCMGGGSRALHQQPSTCAARKLALVVQATLGLSGAGTQQVSAGWVAVCNLRGGGGKEPPLGPGPVRAPPPGSRDADTTPPTFGRHAWLQHQLRGAPQRAAGRHRPARRHLLDGRPELPHQRPAARHPVHHPRPPARGAARQRPAADTAAAGCRVPGVWCGQLGARGWAPACSPGDEAAAAAAGAAAGGLAQCSA